MLLPALASGFLGAGRHLRLTLVLWLTSLLLALPVTAGFMVWWAGDLQYATGADALLTRIDLGVLIDMVEDGQTSPWRVLGSVLLVTSLVTLVVNALVAGGVLELLVAARVRRRSHGPPEARTFTHRFFRGAGHFFWRSLLLLVLTLIVAGIVVAAVSVALRFVLEPFDDSLSIAVSWATLLTPLFVTALIVIFFCVFVLDYARIELVRSDRRNALRVWWIGLTCALRRFWTTLGIWIIIGILLVLLVTACSAARRVLAGGSVSLLVAGFLTQQLFLVAGAWLRLAGLGAEVEAAFRTRADPPSVPVAQPEELPSLVAADMSVELQQTPGPGSTVPDEPSSVPGEERPTAGTRPTDMG